METHFTSPPKLRREIQISPIVKHVEPQIRIQTTNRPQFVPIVSPRQIPVVSPTSQHMQNKKHSKVTLQSSMNESEETVCNPSEHNEHFTRQIPNMGSIVKPSNEHFKMHIPVLNSDSSTHTETFVKTEFLPTCDYSKSTSVDLEGEMVDSAIDSVMGLPQAFNEVVEMQKGQSSEIQKQQMLLKTLQGKFKEVTEKKEEVTQELTSVTHKIYVIEEQKRTCTKKCKEFDSEIIQLVIESEKERNCIKDLKGDIEENNRQYTKYKERITRHKQVVAEFEDNLEVHKELLQIKEEIKKLQTECEKRERNKCDTERLLSGQIENKIKEHILTVQNEVEQLKLILQETKEKIQTEKEKQSQAQVSLNVLHKKNQAQLTRLKKQVKAAQQSSRQWHDQISLLQKTIAELNNRLGQ
ncbi:coiled-coil domain-containing protein 122-like [Mytilus edulis]|uniref:coiled-coil domain-containing protein 122-like n=1 Tax=Mytilus edulis TaxID=6550 RepID=UPI0039F0924D